MIYTGNLPKRRIRITENRAKEIRDNATYIQHLCFGSEPSDTMPCNWCDADREIVSHRYNNDKNDPTEVYTLSCGHKVI